MTDGSREVLANVVSIFVLLAILGSVDDHLMLQHTELSARVGTAAMAGLLSSLLFGLLAPRTVKTWFNGLFLTVIFLAWIRGAARNHVLFTYTLNTFDARDGILALPVIGWVAGRCLTRRWFRAWPARPRLRRVATEAAVLVALALCTVIPYRIGPRFAIIYRAEQQFHFRAPTTVHSDLWLLEEHRANGRLLGTRLVRLQPTDTGMRGSLAHEWAGVSMTIAACRDGLWLPASDRGALTLADQAPTEQVRIPNTEYLTGATCAGNHLWGINSMGQVRKFLLGNGQLLGTYRTGERPAALGFDGSSIWVVNRDSNDVTRLSEASGKTLGTYAVGSQPVALALDDQHIWIANEDSGTVTKLRLDDGALLGTYPAGSTPVALSYDGEDLWVANFGTHQVTRLRGADGTPVRSYPVQGMPIALAWVGSDLLVASDTLVERLEEARRRDR